MPSKLSLRFELFEVLGIFVLSMRHGQNFLVDFGPPDIYNTLKNIQFGILTHRKGIGIQLDKYTQLWIFVSKYAMKNLL